MNRKTPVFTGSERLSRKLDTEVWYFYITRKRRGYYKCNFQLMYDRTKELPDFAVTEKYMRLLEDNIKEYPGRGYLRPKSAGISPHFLVSHFMI